MGDTEWRIRFWSDEAEKYTRNGDELTASGKHDEAKSAYWNAARALNTVRENTHDSAKRVLIDRSRAMLSILGGAPHVAERIAAKQIADGIESEATAAEFRAIIRLAWRAQGITAKGDRASSDTFASQRRRVRAAMTLPQSAKDE